jgi:hypothetical protein
MLRGWVRRSPVHSGGGAVAGGGVGWGTLSGRCPAKVIVGRSRSVSPVSARAKYRRTAALFREKFDMHGVLGLGLQDYPCPPF